MDNWENNLIANKLNNLQDLPEGYKPNLASKWEIIEAGFPKDKKVVPLFKWSIAATTITVLILLGLLIKSNFGKKTIASQLPNTKKRILFLSNSTINLKQKITNDNSNILITINKTKTTANNHSNKKIVSDHRQNRKLIAVYTIPVLESTQPANVTMPTIILAPTLSNLDNIPTNKSIKHITYQKDFNNNTLK